MTEKQKDILWWTLIITLIVFLVSAFVWVFNDMIHRANEVQVEDRSSLYLKDRGGIFEIAPYVISENYLIAMVAIDISTDLKASSIMFKESSDVHEKWGDIDYPYPAYGIAQFQNRTFDWLASMSGRTDLVWENKQDQIWLLKWALKNNYGYLWSTF